MFIDSRLSRLAGVSSSLILIAVLATQSAWLAVAQAIICALATSSPRLGLYGALFNSVVAPRIKPPERVDLVVIARLSHRMIGLASAVAAVSYLLGSIVVGSVAVGCALIVAVLEACGCCLGARLYLLLDRIRRD